MSDLKVDEEHLRAAVTQLNSASTPVAGACDATDACGSTTVQAALGEVETIVRGALAALVDLATRASADVSTAAQVFDDADTSLAQGGSGGGVR